MSSALFHPEAVAAIIGVIGTAVGVLIGAFVQPIVAMLRRKYHERRFLLYASFYISELRTSLQGFTNKDTVLHRINLGESIHKAILDEHEVVRSQSRLKMPSITGTMLWLAVSVSNVREYAKAGREALNDGDYKSLDNFAYWITVDAKKGLSYCDTIARHILDDADLLLRRKMPHLGKAQTEN